MCPPKAHVLKDRPQWSHERLGEGLKVVTGGVILGRDCSGGTLVQPTSVSCEKQTWSLSLYSLASGSHQAALLPATPPAPPTPPAPAAHVHAPADALPSAMRSSPGLRECECYALISPNCEWNEPIFLQITRSRAFHYSNWSGPIQACGCIAYLIVCL